MSCGILFTLPIPGYESLLFLCDRPPKHQGGHFGMPRNGMLPGVRLCWICEDGKDPEWTRHVIRRQMLLDPVEECGCAAVFVPLAAIPCADCARPGVSVICRFCGETRCADDAPSHDGAHAGWPDVPYPQQVKL